MRRGLAAFIVAAVLGPASAHASSVELRLGGFVPRADSRLFLDDEDLFGTKKSDWSGPLGGLEFSLGTGRNTELGFHIDGYGRSLDTHYRRRRRESGGEIFQTLELNTVPVGMTFRYVAGRRHSRFRPYVGVGVDIVPWEYKETGSFIDFDTDEIINNDQFIANGAAPGAHGVVGLRFAITPDIFLTAEGKYLVTRTVEMKDDFEVFSNDVPRQEINLSGAAATIGVLVRF
jgi:opacity protein-like surface antigen